MSREYRVDRSLRWRQVSVTLVWIGLLVVGAVGLLVVSREPMLPTLFFAGVGGGLLTVSAVVGWLGIRTVSRSITLATLVTLSRGAAVAVLAGFLVAGSPAGWSEWEPAVLFAVAAGLDAVDGAVARATDSVTELGSRLDTEMDGLTVLVGTLLVVVEGLVPAVFLIVGVARYLFVFGIWLRQRRGLSVEPLPESQLRRVLGGLAMATIWIGLLPVSEPAVSRPVAVVVLVPFVLNFSRDWLAVSGRR